MVNTHVHVVIPPSRQDNQQQQQHSPSSVKAASVHPATDALPEDDSHAAMHGATFTASQSKLPKLFDSNNHNIGDDDLMGDASVCTPPQVQLPGDMVRAILGFVDGASLKCQTAECEVLIPHFKATGYQGPDRIVSDTFCIDGHSFCLWIFPRGNPNEAEYFDRALSVYLVTDACGGATIEWHSSLNDNKFDQALYNWGVHSLGDLASFEPSGFVFPDRSLHVAARVRVMAMTIRVHLEAGLLSHQGLGLGPPMLTLDVPFCATLADLMAALAGALPLLDLRECRVQAKRPRKCLSTLAAATMPLFGNLLCDGTDIDAYSTADVFVDPAGLDSFVFLKVLERSGVLRFVGRLQLSTYPTPHDMVAYMATVFPRVADWRYVREECAPQLMSPLSPSDRLQPSDVVIFVAATNTPSNDDADHWMTHVRHGLNQYLERRYDHARSLLANELHHMTLHDVETIGDMLDVPRFRVHSVFAKCREDARRTLSYIMEGRHLGFICDSCGETDFGGARYNCTVCSDYDLCHRCYGASNVFVCAC
ncbi:hypothetical protein DYB25_002637 [Aphanomyces astaci]|uniref:ZZ-type domain-containing protein n=1 Tax=Aphanomyces astaci TaxID=112090 RepID=A0A397DLQ5_APHAT|nr:hypothetical protein DYB25_002637 [Aphanomyces astaci]RHY67532.1 hypothetical protein DYB30_004924 [Aphanomyces astaci]RHY70870.1 hypothetical protein DYB34_009208 [Aphanomyces astaci]RHY76683.1 hypothetical protein DYB38_005163 [Aphanomyces astaci]RHZ01822.1 hypothetical protein DYB31_005387 [Aphanomyces astaci]